MSTVAASTTRRRWYVVVLGLLVAAVLAGLGTTVVSLLTQAAGGSADFRPLQPATYFPLVVIGVVIGALGWWVVSRGRRPRRVMTRIVVLVSFAPDLILGFTGMQADTT